MCPALLVGFLALGCADWGTTVVLFVTPEAVVLGVDSQIISQGKSSTKNPRPLKSVLLKDRLAVVTAWLTSIQGMKITDTLTGQTYSFDYEFESWIRAIEKKLPRNVTVTELARAIQEESRSTFKDYGLLIQAGVIQPDPSRLPILVRYYVSGYEKSAPTVLQIEFQFDWPSRRLMGPTRIRIHPSEGRDDNFLFRAGGVHSEIDKVLQRKGEAYKRIVELAPKEIMKLLAQQNLSVEEATRLSVALISLEAEANPEKVSFPVRVITLPKNGGGNIAVYDRVF